MAKAWMAGPQSGDDVAGADLRWILDPRIVAIQADPATL
jgi:hypothetical protein